MGKAPRQLTINSRTYSASCGRCAAAMLPNATVCLSCGGFAVDHDRRISYARPFELDFDVATVQTVVRPLFDEAAMPSYARPNPERISTILGSWPFGAADASDGPAFTAVAEVTPPTPRLELLTHRSDVPSQRAEMESVPSVGPNPFLSAARIQQAHERVAAL